ncbi:CDP-alcohol phosphatidyltransferase family protein [Candidatus Leptofilum sp.]|uniref:CDP-alcohol phosphatidyltransferase family protein n=1 Tax=Candidatus Leptofilum sp. TaxID=3241576 RepID=UPI003B594CA3
MNSRYRYLIPNGITFISLTCGIVSILLAATGELVVAGILILASYILDLFDGASARYLNAGSEFGLQLDSLVDMVSLGTAPAVLAFMYLYLENAAATAILAVLAIFFALAGAYRLARFNLLPPKASGRGDSAGLTISSAGATLALAVVSDMTILTVPLPAGWLMPIMLICSILMISLIPFPSFRGVFKGRVRIGTLLVLFAVTIAWATFGKAWHFWNTIYLGWGLARAGYLQINE